MNNIKGQSLHLKLQVILKLESLGLTFDQVINQCCPDADVRRLTNNLRLS